MVKKGRMKWVPKGVLEEVNSVKVEDGLFSDSEAMRKMVNYSRVGRELDRMRRLYIPKKKKGKGGGF